MTGCGRLLELTNGSFADVKHAEAVVLRTAALENVEGQVWVVCVSSPGREADVRGEFHLNGS